MVKTIKIGNVVKLNTDYTVGQVSTISAGSFGKVMEFRCGGYVGVSFIGLTNFNGVNGITIPIPIPTRFLVHDNSLARILYG